MDPQLSILKTEPPRKGNRVLLGIGLTVLLHLLQLPLLFFDKPWILFFGITQLLYIVPAIYFFNKRDDDGIARGLIIGASITFVLGFPFAGLAILCGMSN